MNWDDELEAAQARRAEKERLWMSAMAAQAIGPAFVKHWHDGLTPAEQVLFQEILEEHMAGIRLFLEGARQAFIELGRRAVSGLREAFEAFGITADGLLQAERRYDVNAPRLYWDGRKVDRVGRYRPYRSNGIGK